MINKPIAVTTETSATQKAYEALRRMLVTGELQPGEKLKVSALKTRLDTGASPIREALSLLTSDHLVERIDQKGFRAAATSLQNFQEILNLRCALEDAALRESINFASIEWEENLVLVHHRLQRETRDNIERFETHHKAFHMALLSGSPSPILLKFCSQLYDLNIRYRFIAARSLGYQARDVTGEHDAILQAALKKDAESASSSLLDHYRKTGAYLTDLMGDSIDE